MALLCLINSLSFAQNQSGVATYNYIDGFGQPTEYKLYFNAEKSKYVANRGAKGRLNKVGETVLTKNNFSEVTSVNKKIFTYFIDEEGDVFLQNWKNNTLVFREIQQHYPLIVHEPNLPKIKWKLSTETKKIGKFNCQKATTTFRGRKYEAWFTPEIPVPSGPWKLHGLPGLILEAQDESKTYVYNFVDITMPLASTDSQELNYTPKVGDEVKLSDYHQEVKKREAEYHRAMISKAAQRGSTITISPSNNPPQELSFEK